jgi:hypothetical protein
MKAKAAEIVATVVTEAIADLVVVTAKIVEWIWTLAIKARVRTIVLNSVPTTRLISNLITKIR